MSLWVRSVLVGTAATAFLVSAALVSARTSSLFAFESAAIYLLTPGIVMGFAFGSGHVHDTSFWVQTAILNAVIYSLLAAPCVLALEKFRSRTSSKNR